MRRLPSVLMTAAMMTLLVGCGSGGAGASTPRDAPPDQTAEEIRQHIDEARFDEAESLSRELLDRTASERGADAIETSRVLDLLVETLWRARKTDEPETRELAERALRIKKNQLGPNHLDTATSLLNLAVVLEFTGSVSEAEPLYLRALSIRERELGPRSLELADALNFTANMYLNTSRFAEAEPLYERVIEIRMEVYGPDHPRVAHTLSNLANLRHQIGEYDNSIELYRRTLEIEERAYGPDHLDVAWTLNGLATVLWETGAYEEARESYERALRIREKILGPDHIHVGMTLNNIGMLSTDMGDYTYARSVLQRAVTIFESELGATSAYTATARNNLAELYSRMGDYAEALRIQEGVLATRIKAYGPEDVGVAATLKKIAAIQAALGEHANAAATYRRVLAIYEEKLGTEHMEYGRALDGLAEAYRAMGRTDEARNGFDRALKILEKSLGSDHPSVAQILEALALLDLDPGRARSYLERALAIREAALGSQHPEVGSTVALLAEALARDGNTSGAFQLALRAEAMGREHLKLTMRTLPERQALRYAEVRASGLDLILTLVEAGELGDVATRQAWDALCRSRALVLDEMAMRRGARSRYTDPNANMLEQRLAAASRRLANLTLSGPKDMPPDRYRGLIDDARREKERAEVTLAEASAAFREEEELERTGIDRVVASLPEGMALVAFARNRDVYVAFVLGSGKSRPVAVPLGPAAEIDERIVTWRDEASRGLLRPNRSAVQAEAAYRKAGIALREKIWDPLSSSLGESRRVLIVPDAMIHLVNVATLPTGRDRYLIESGPVVQLLSAERDVVTYGELRETPRGRGLLALGGPAFDELADAGPSAGARTFRGGLAGCADFRSLRFPSLPASAREVDAIATLWNQTGRGHESEDDRAIRLKGAEASEASFKLQAAGRRVLHLATHGFFLGESCVTYAGHRGVGGLATAGGVGTALPPAGDNPLILSGLALAGANRRDAATPETEDGILTAEEIAAMDLRGVQWAVLSACDTGVGKVQAGEGVLGLQRAFQIAGAGTVIMSLWSVGDENTDLWMRALYEGRLDKGFGTAEAVREAALSLLRRQRKEAQTTHPFHWGAFVSAGDWH